MVLPAAEQKPQLDKELLEGLVLPVAADAEKPSGLAEEKPPARDAPVVLPAGEPRPESDTTRQVLDNLLQRNESVDRRDEKKPARDPGAEQ